MTYYRKKGKKIIKNGSVFLLICALAAPVTVSAAEPNTPKEEVAYVNLNSDGSVKEVDMVNIFQLDEDQEITDYGDYSSVRNMTTDDEIAYTGDTVHINAKSGKLYYEGKCAGSAIPWNISIHYFLDGEEYSADEIAGKSGALKITVNISKNEECGGNFFDTHALQMTIKLDTDKCENIQADDATVANAGGDKQLTYTILPGKETAIEITADVTEFEMDRISINGIPLNLNVEVDDASLKKQVTKLSDAVAKLDDGASELDDGTTELKDSVQSDLRDGVHDLSDGADRLHTGTASLKNGGDSLKSGAADLKSGVSELDNGIKSLDEGIQKTEAALDTLDSQSPALTDGSAEMKSALRKLQAALDEVAVTAEDLSALTKASSDILSGIDTLAGGVTALQKNVSFEMYKNAMQQNGLDIDALRKNNETAIASLQSMIASLQGQAAAMQQAGADTTALEAQIQQLSQIAELLAANNGSISGTEAYLTTVSQNIDELLQGAVALRSNYALFDEKIGSLVGALNNIVPEMTALKSAVDTLVSEYEKLDSGIVSYTGAVAEITEGFKQVSSGSAQLVSGSRTLLNGTETLYSGTNELVSGINTLYQGTDTLKDGTVSLNDGTDELLDGVSELHDGTAKLKDGTSKIKRKTSGMDKKIDKKIDKMLDTITGSEKEIVSFASPKNTNVQAVQFVIQTDAVKMPEKEITEAPAEKPAGFLDKLKELFSSK